MIVHRLLAGIGRTLIAVGALVLAFAAFQYWGTGLAEAQAQEELDDQFLARLQAMRDGSDSTVADDPTTTTDTTTGSTTGTGQSANDPADRPVSTTAAPMLDLADVPRAGDAAGRIIIAAIGVDKTYVQGVARDDLRTGPGHYPLTPFPGQPGNAAIAGHRTTYGAPFFDLDKLVPGDEIIVETLQGRFSYLVNGHENAAGESVGHFIVDPTATWVLDDQGDSRLTLTACHPKRSAAQRIVVTATLNTTPAPPTPIPLDALDDGDGELASEFASDDAIDDDAIDELITDDLESLDESLGWRPEHWPTTAAWAAICAAIAAAGWLLGRRWRPRPAYAMAAGPFLACLFVCFTHLDKLLPAI